MPKRYRFCNFVWFPIHKLSLSISFKDLIISFNITSINIYQYLSISINCLTVSSISGADRVGFISQVLYDRAKMYLALWWMFTMGVKTPCWNLSRGRWVIGARAVSESSLCFFFWWFEICHHGAIVWLVLCIEESSLLLSKGLSNLKNHFSSYSLSFLWFGIPLQSSTDVTSMQLCRSKSLNKDIRKYKSNDNCKIVIGTYWSGIFPLGKTSTLN